VRHVDLRQSDEEPRVLPAPPYIDEMSEAEPGARRSYMSSAATRSRSAKRATVRGAPRSARGLFVAAGLGFAAILPLFLSEGGNALENMVLAAAYVIMALGLNIVVGFAGLLDLGYVAFFAIGAHVAAYFGSAFWANAADGAGIALFVGEPTASLPGIHFNFLIILVLAVMATTLAGVLIGVPTLRVRGDYVGVVTLAFGEIIGQVVSNGRQIEVFGGSLTGGPAGVSAIDRIDLPFLERFGVLDLRPWYWFALALVALMLFVNFRLRDSRVGRAWIALRDDEDAAASAGVPIVRTKLLAYGVGAALGGVSGAFLASYLSTVNTDQFSFSFSIFILAMVVLGGLGSIWGVVVGAILLSAINNLLLPKVLYDVPSHLGLDFDLSEISSGIYGFLLVIIMLLRPEGLLPERRGEMRSTGYGRFSLER
jgi:branched-chain amino acid transport system permease protein